MAFCVCVCAHAASLCRRLKGKLRGEEEARRERKCGGKPLTAVAQGSGFLCRSRKTTVSGASRESSGILSRFCLQGCRTGGAGTTSPTQEKKKSLQAALLMLQLSGTAFTRSHLLKPPSLLSS